jgi:T5SS/PEP-CTERM-associated repeat protein
LVLAAAVGWNFAFVPTAFAAVASSGDVNPVPPLVGGNVNGPLRIGITDVGNMDISGGVELTSTNAAILGDMATGLGIVTMDGFLSDWVLTTAGADLTVGNNGTGSANLVNQALLSVNDDLVVAAQLNSLGEVSISGLGTVMIVGDDATIAMRGQASVVISDGGRLRSDANVIGDEAASDGRVAVTDQFSLWRGASAMTVGDAGRGLLQVLDGARVENTSGVVGMLAGSTGTVEVDGLGSLWQNSTSLTVADLGHGTLLVTDGGRVTTGGGVNLTSIGRQSGAVGQVEIDGVDSLLQVTNFRIGELGDGALRILGGGRVTSATAILGDNPTARGTALVAGAGTLWDIAGELIVSDPGEGHVTIADGAVVRSLIFTRVNALGRITLDGGRLEAGGSTAILNSGIIEGHGEVEAMISNNNASGQIRVTGPGKLTFTGMINNAGLIDVQSGELEIAGAMNNNGAEIDARDGAVLRFGGGLDNGISSQLAITSGIVDVFGAVDNNSGAEIVVGGSAVAVFHDVLTNNGNLIVQPGGELLALENLGLAAGAALSIGLADVDLTEPGSDPTDGFGQLQVGGAAALAGTLAVDLLGGFVPAAGDLFQIVTAGGGRTGVFGTEMLPALPGGLDWDVQYHPDSVVLAVIVPGLVGDYNQNGTVDAADYVLWRNTLGTMSDLRADGNGNGQIDPGDYDVWRANFGRAGGSGATSAHFGAVPEPCSSVLFFSAAVIAFCWMGGHRRQKECQHLASFG